MVELLNSVTSYEAPDPGRVRVTEIPESDIKSDDLVYPKANTSSSHSDDEWYVDREAVEIQHRRQRDAKQTKNSKIVCLIQVEYKI